MLYQLRAPWNRSANYALAVVELPCTDWLRDQLRSLQEAIKFPFQQYLTRREQMYILS